MAEITWPDIALPDYGTTQDVEDTSIQSTFEDGTVQGRRKFTKSRKTWVLKWDAMPLDDYNRLIDFLQNTVHFAASTFLWTSPIDQKKYTVRFAAKEEFTTVAVKRMSGSITLKEA
ncbi:hypothetical protein [Megasphaera elsdenii]|jgi:phage-related protein|uniref:hypothetical protein n=1 Tax=Megasphaera elsdenii TaxID=907 RepID=UPI002A800785|nr:hypothetical protein [Megasphaera elsdenii]MCI7200437.1 hypothetical protein [Megasphaera elsdenii]MDY4265552.1 hypothetical protein [Megasphaera elsdenii]